jgi:class 3 adenylate cyclase
MECSRCGTLNESPRKFCKECGAALSTVCAVCGTANDPSSKFCGECGSSLLGAAEGRPRPGGPPDVTTERRLVSVLFVDLVGFTSYAEQHDAEDVRAVLGRYFDTAADAVRSHGGTVEKYIGDAVMAVWGTPVAHEDDAERAVRAALEVVMGVAVLGRSLGLPLQARAGVLTGEAAATVGAVDQGLVTGDLVNTASRLQSAAEPGTVLVGERTFRVASQAISFVPVEPLLLKGKLDPVPAWRAVRVVAERGGSMRGEAPEPPFVGRDDDLRLVKDLLLATGREQRPRLVKVTGVAGIGKSRLVWELQKYVDGLSDDVYWHQGRCLSYGEGVAFWAFAEMVRRRARIADSDDADTARERLTASIAELVHDEDERRWLEPRLGHLLGLNVAPAGDREELFGAWRRYVERVADLGTTVLVFEDLHWADQGLLDFVESLLRWSRSSPILVVALARPELAERRPGWGSTLREVVSLHLDPLPDPAVVDLVTGYVHGLPPDGLAHLVRRAEGVPLYAVETVRMLADRGVLEQVGETYTVVSDVTGDIEMPETLHALVAARLDGLPDEQRGLLQDASVVGQRFTLAGLAAVSGRAGAELEQMLADLTRKELLSQDVDPRSPERGQYGFVQSVLREVAYSTLSKAARRTRHLAAAEFFESLDEPDMAGVVATHYLDAYRAEPSAPGAEDVADLARTWLAKAAERAQSLGSPEQALVYAEQALPLVTQPEDRGPLLGLAATAAVFAGVDLDRGMALLRDAISTYQAMDDREAIGRLVALNVRPFFGRSRMADVEELLAAAQSAMEGRRGAVAAVVAGLLADHAAGIGDQPTALAHAEFALQLAEESGDPGALRAAASAKGWALMNIGRHWEGALLARGVLDLAERSGSTLDFARAWMSLGVGMAEEDPRAAMNAFLTAAEHSAAAGVRPLESLNHANASEAATDVGEWDIADHELAAAEDIATAAREETGLILTRAMLAAMRGDAVTGLALMAGVGDIDRQTESVQLQTWYWRALAVVRLTAGDAEGGLAAARRAVELEPAGGNASNATWAGVRAACALRDAAAIEDLMQQTAALRGTWFEAVRRNARALVDCLRERPPAASAESVAALTTALAEWQALDLPLDHALAVTAAAYAVPADQLAAEHLEAARATLRTLGADGLQARLDEALGSRG